MQRIWEGDALSTEGGGSLSHDTFGDGAVNIKFDVEDRYLFLIVGSCLLFFFITHCKQITGVFGFKRDFSVLQ